MLRTVLFGLLVVAEAACGGAKQRQQQPATSKTTNDPPGAPPVTVTKRNDSDSGAGTSSAPATSVNVLAKEERPFAGSAAEATSMISAVVDKKQDEIAGCVREFRVRKKMAHDRVAVSFGIDQEGRLLGVTSKGKEDAELKGCVQDVLKRASFPRSHAGVITVTKSYEEIIK